MRTPNAHESGCPAPGPHCHTSATGRRVKRREKRCKPTPPWPAQAPRPRRRLTHSQTAKLPRQVPHLTHGRSSSARKGRQADRSVRVPRPDNHRHLVCRSRRPQSRPPRAPPPSSVVPPEDLHQLRRHAHRATPRTDPPRVMGTSTPDNHHTKTHATPVTTSARRRLKPRKSRHVEQALSGIALAAGIAQSRASGCCGPHDRS